MRKLYAFLLAFVLSTATLFSASEVLARTVEDCEKFFNNYIGPVVNARDSGMDPNTIVQQLLMIGVNQKAAVAIVGMVYQVHKDKDKDFIEKDYMNWCVPVSANSL